MPETDVQGSESLAAVKTGQRIEKIEGIFGMKALTQLFTSEGRPAGSRPKQGVKAGRNMPNRTICKTHQAGDFCFIEYAGQHIRPECAGNHAQNNSISFDAWCSEAM
jgi:hypothetical protein